MKIFSAIGPFACLCALALTTSAALAAPKNEKKPVHPPAHAEKAGAEKRGAESVDVADVPADQADDVDDAEQLDLSALPPNRRAAIEAARAAKWIDGPTTVSLPFDCTLTLPAGYVYLDVPQSQKLLTANGHFHNERSMGIIGSANDEEEWRVFLDYTDEGYVKDDEKVDANALFQSLKEGQNSANEERKAKGFEPLLLRGWAEVPRYDAASHQLVWGLSVYSPGETSSTTNYNTRILGRKGFISLNLVSDADRLPEFKAHVPILLNATKFNSGSRYEDYRPGNDKVAEYGLAGLILGGAGLGIAKVAGKVGLLALLAKGGKGFLLLLFAPFVALKKLFARKSVKTES